ncbi:MAG: bifunctional phosphoribosyl-AMP cyclohydrolase/phosphoribosyl-ATP diphosphatase HisIE [Pseudomonadota bacterium]
MSISDKVDWEKVHGLVPAIVQDYVTGRVLMLGYMNRESLLLTETNKLVTFFSRTRQELWTKGETSGNVLNLKSLQLDCDHDTILVEAEPAGPTCHLNINSCFDDEVEQPGYGFLGKLESLIDQRIKHRPEGSYTTELLEAGTKRMAQKVGEEAVEVALAADNIDTEELVAESADLLFHLLLLLKHKSLSLTDICQELAQRHNPKK